MDMGNTKLRAEGILNAIENIKERIFNRFPSSSLNKIAIDLISTAKEIITESTKSDNKNIIIRFTSFAFCFCILSILIYFFRGLILKFPEDFTSFVTLLEASLGASVFIGATILYLNSLEAKYKRKKAISIIHKLRVLSHVIDMHQVSKDPSNLIKPKLNKEITHNYKTKDDLSKYYDYCSELLSMISKVAAYYIQNSDDHEVRESVDQIEILTTNLSRKIWQK